MSRLGYGRWLAQGGDWRGAVTHELAKLGPTGLAGVHLNFFPVFQPPVSDPPTPEEQAALDNLGRFFDDGAGFVYGPQLIYFDRVARGGHFAAFEQPELFTEQLRRFARLVR